MGYLFGYTMINLPKLDSRLQTAVAYLRKGAVMYDVGTDHAYLPIYSVAAGISSSAVASDINEGPTERARANVASYGMSDKITVIRSDGLSCVRDYSPSDIVIFGMGGELIAGIIEKAPYVKNENIRLILQPMTCSDILREFLAENGFEIKGETLSEDTGKIYVTICAEYSGVSKVLSDTERIFGEKNITENAENPIFSRLVHKTETAYETRLRGKAGAGHDTSEEERILSEIKKMKEELQIK